MASAPGVASRPRVSIVVPVYGCAGCLEALCERIDQTLAAFPWEYEVILVDDRSPDQAWTRILALRQRFPRVRGVRLSRNFGQHLAITAGLARVRGDATVVMDCDLQDPPELIPDLLAKLDEGFDLVLARRVRRSHSLARRVASSAYFRLVSLLTEEEIDGSYGTFSVLSRKVVDAFLAFSERERHYLFILRWLGFRVGTVDFEQPERHSGRSSYTLGRLIRHAIDGLFFQATVLLRWIVTLGMLCALSGVALAGFYIIRYFLHGSLPGWTSLSVLILMSTGIVLTSLGVIGQYIGKIFEQSKGRPLYVVDVLAEGPGDGPDAGVSHPPFIPTGFSRQD